MLSRINRLAEHIAGRPQRKGFIRTRCGESDTPPDRPTKDGCMGSWAPVKKAVSALRRVLGRPSTRYAGSREGSRGERTKPWLRAARSRRLGLAAARMVLMALMAWPCALRRRLCSTAGQTHEG